MREAQLVHLSKFLWPSSTKQHMKERTSVRKKHCYTEHTLSVAYPLRRSVEIDKNGRQNKYLTFAIA